MKIKGGLYLIADALLDETTLMQKMKTALENGVAIVQLYHTEQADLSVIGEIISLCHHYDVPVLVSDHWALLKTLPADGVHFDRIPTDFETVQIQVNRPFLKGVTCSNDLSVITRANELKFDYISFCSMFPSPSAGACEIVKFDTVRKARAMTNIPFFVAGGIRPENMPELNDIPFDGVAVISGIMSANDVAVTTREYVSGLIKK